MTQGKLFILGQEVELLWTDMNYHRDTRKNGKPATEIMGGLITVCYATDHYSDLVLRWMTKESEDDTWNEADKMEKGKVCFYQNGFDYPPTKTYDFNDSHLIYFKEIFNTEGKQPMQTILTISPAIQNYGVEFVKLWNHSWIPPSERMPYQPAENNDEFYLSIKHLTNKKTFVPLGIPAFSGTPENKEIEFEIEITENDIDDFQVEFLHDNKVIQTYYSGRQTLDEVVITAKVSGNTSNSNASNNQNAQSNYPKGKYSLKWDGFDSNGIYDSTIFTTGKLKARIIGKRNGKEKTAESSEFAFEYKKVNWVDTKINKNGKRIDVTLRVNLIDGGENGTEKDCYELGKSRNAPIVKICPWDKIPKKTVERYGMPIKSRTKSFEDLRQLALEGINNYWSRHKGNIGKGIEINGELYDVFINAVNEIISDRSIDDVPLIYNTNNNWSRSGNTGGSYKDGNLDDEAMSLLPNGLVQRISYNVGYIKYSNGWFYQNGADEDDEFKETSAHEIGHELLQAFGGTIYSWQHKGSSYYFPQDTKPIDEESFVEEHINIDFMEETSGETYPKGEIDLMKYYNGRRPYDFFDRRIANTKDVLGLIWLSKIEIK